MLKPCLNCWQSVDASAPICFACGRKSPTSFWTPKALLCCAGAAILFVGFTIGVSDGYSPRPPRGAAAAVAVPRPAPPSESDFDRLVRETKSEAVYAGGEVIGQFLKAPTQAKYSDRELLRQKDNYALVRMTVDAPNSFGVMLRQRWCAVVVFQPPRGDRYSWNKLTGAWRCDGHVLDEDEALTREMLAGWPGAADELSARHPAQQRKTRRHVNEGGGL